MPFYRIVIDCNIAGCREEYFTEADNEQDAEDFAEQLAHETFGVYGTVEEEITREQADEERLPEA